MHNHNRDGFFQEGRFGAARRQDAPGRCDRQEGRREFGQRPGGPRFGEDGPRGFRGGPRGPRAKPGNMRLAILALLQEEPRNGYGMIQEISQRSGGLWQPSPGAMYPALAGLEDEGLITVQPQEGKKVYALTEAGQTYVQENQEALKELWTTEQEGGRGNHIDLRSALQALMGATMQIAKEGNEAQLRQAQTILKDARKGLYRLLAEDDSAQES